MKKLLLCSLLSVLLLVSPALAALPEVTAHCGPNPDPIVETWGGFYRECQAEVGPLSPGELRSVYLTFAVRNPFPGADGARVTPCWPKDVALRVSEGPFAQDDARSGLVVGQGAVIPGAMRVLVGNLSGEPVSAVYVGLTYGCTARVPEWGN